MRNTSGIVRARHGATFVLLLLACNVGNPKFDQSGSGAGSGSGSLGHDSGDDGLDTSGGAGSGSATGGTGSDATDAGGAGGGTTSGGTTDGPTSGGGSSTTDGPTSGDSSSTTGGPTSSGGSSTTGAPTGDSGSSADSTGGSSTGGGHGGYPECDWQSDPPCPSGYDECYDVGPVSWCTIYCNTDDECPLPSSGEATRLCSPGGGYICTLDCANGRTCPSGMQCVNVGGGEMRCGWP